METIVCRRFVIATAVICCAFGCAEPSSHAATLPHSQGIIGDPQQYKIRADESLIEVARDFDLGFNAIVAANPGVDPLIPRAGTLIDIPTAWILPDVPMSAGIVINLPEFRLYYFSPELLDLVATFPLGIGDEGRDTPVGSYIVSQKITAPAWHVPKSIRLESAHLPKVVPPGPDNPLGSHALRLSLTSFLIHGTNRPWGIGRRSSHGCLRLYPEDIIELYGMVPAGTRVVITDQPVKAASIGERVFIEVHRYGAEECSVSRALHLLADKNLLIRTDFAKLLRAMEEMKGVPVDVTLSRAP